MQRCLQNEEQVKPIYFICICIKAIQVIKREFQYLIFIKIGVSKINFNCHRVFLQESDLEMSRNVQSGNTQNLKSMVIQRSFPKWSVAERRKTAAASDQAAVCACAHSRYFTGGSPSGLRV